MANPTLKEAFIKDSFNSLEGDSAMTVNGTILKTCFLSLFTMGTFCYTWYLFLNGFLDKVSILYNVGIFGGLILSFAICFMPKNKSLIVTTPLYAMCEGLALGYISAIANKFYPGIVVQATLGTFFAILGMFVLYSTKVIKCTEKFRAVIYTSLFAVLGVRILELILGLFHLPTLGIFSNSLIGIGFSFIVVAVASFCLIVDFDNIESLSGRADKILEWYFGFSLLVTIIWLYIEILQLLMKFQSRNN